MGRVGRYANHSRLSIIRKLNPFMLLCEPLVESYIVISVMLSETCGCPHQQGKRRRRELETRTVAIEE
jgi:hypothetical protein